MFGKQNTYLDKQKYTFRSNQGIEKQGQVKAHPRIPDV